MGKVPKRCSTRPAFSSSGSFVCTIVLERKRECTRMGAGAASAASERCATRVAFGAVLSSRVQGCACEVGIIYGRVFLLIWGSVVRLLSDVQQDLGS